MQRGVDAPKEIKVQALALYAETFSTHKAADRMREEGIEVHHSSIYSSTN